MDLPPVLLPYLLDAAYPQLPAVLNELPKPAIWLSFLAQAVLQLIVQLSV